MYETALIPCHFYTVFRGF